MDPQQHPNRHGERGLRAVTSSPVASAHLPGAASALGCAGRLADARAGRPGRRSARHHCLRGARSTRSPRRRHVPPCWIRRHRRFGSPSAHIGRWPVGAGPPASTATRSTIGSCCEPRHAIRDGAAAGEPVAVAVRITQQEWRRRWQRSPEIVTDRLPEQPIGDDSEQVVNRHLVAAALGRLTQEHRDVLRECYFLGSSVAQAAHALGIAPGTVKSRTYYALRALRLAIEELRDVE